ncbi:hypothetical protein AM493_15530 [Flavobacterium akiainvivens]|uniref:Uncharacterized protein n=1 Tax=Flavobacterium akiainvivens TaxID=1202724 RepID=A0A0M9VJ36_9FLAO|nr:hypothetical protein [Flavobacterium akiainvivens]KOS07292.1 hypothetical protein AM493_15530 [Flavobacterium akiainvivens]SFQ46275.1 hypothetical protein SAMN05444144_10588 [Flavobacterium akiainvivens]
MKNLLRFLGIIVAIIALMYQAMRFVFDFFTLRAHDTRNYTWPMAVSIAVMVATLAFGVYCFYGLVAKKPTTNKIDHEGIDR